MNRQVAQILIGATALTGAFFFGSVMQRRHGDLEKTSSNQPMLEHEDLVWHSGPENGSAQGSSSAANSPPSNSQLAIAESTAGRPTSPLTGTDESNARFPASGNERSAEGQLDPQTSQTVLERKVVQPDFSRWSNPSNAAGTDGERPSPMLPLTAPPPLLGNPAQPAGEITNRTAGPSDPLDPIVAGTKLPAAEPPASDPWTAPLSSVLLKPPTTSPIPAEGVKPDSEFAGKVPQPATAPAPAAPTRLATSELVPVNPSNLRKADVDTDSFRIHVTRPGDTLQALALKYYGKADYYLDIYLANQDQLESPIQLPVGKPLKIPDYGK